MYILPGVKGFLSSENENTKINDVKGHLIAWAHLVRVRLALGSHECFLCKPKLGVLLLQRLFILYNFADVWRTCQRNKIAKKSLVSRTVYELGWT